ncbi:hypothetical protein CDD80_61 [Ophiocordyceps camponoti-rufipedis]|uniref:Uncharacterized protein n=1 Tax=Ophiocordyceps camponoti-rufipedis TaxID=2004952 RepID=A0A2C5ZLJ5_9HYPO|nr:hypothetical protein CDD80_61 [Ophiocordyceps camponoti-rufipedis]
MDPTTSSHKDTLMPIAIVGMAGRFPGEATNPDRLWDMLCRSESALSEVPADRFNIDAFYHPCPEHQGSTNARGGNFLQQDVARFDAPFFSITPKEAQALDPQQRLALEVVYEGLENAGMSIGAVSGSSTACYMAVFTKDYATLRGHDPEEFPQQNLLVLQPSWAQHQSRHSLFFFTRRTSPGLSKPEERRGSNSGTNIILMPELQTAMASLHFLSPDCKSMAFDYKANGYARGEGAAVVILKPLADALRDGNVIRAVIRGSGVNQDGKTPGITVPSLMAQKELIISTYAKAGLDFEDTCYVEAHGTGTPVGDPIECAAIGATIGQGRTEPVLIGSAKTNIGHLESAAGLVGLIKAVYALEKGLIPPSLWFERANPKIPLEHLNLKVATELQTWPASGLRRASVNSFGYGGTNAHCILDDALHYLQSRGLNGAHNTTQNHREYTNGQHRCNGTSVVNGNGHLEASSSINGDGHLSFNRLERLQASISKPRLFVWSSHDELGVSRTAKNLNSFLGSRSDLGSADEDFFLARMASTLFRTRAGFSWRSFAVASSIKEACSSIEKHSKPVSQTKSPAIAFIFTGQGAQWFAMGRELLVFDAFHQSLKAAAAYCEALGSGWNLIANGGNWPLKRRGGGQDEAKAFIQENELADIVVACINSPLSVTLSGDKSAIIRAKALLDDDKVFNRKLAVTTAYHSPHMSDIAGEYSEALGEIAAASAPDDDEVQMFSSVTGELIAVSELAQTSHWVENMLRPVKFQQAVEAALCYRRTVKSERRIGTPNLMLEIGPHSVLQLPLKHILDACGKQQDVKYTTMLARKQDASRTALNAMGFLFQQGYEVNVDEINRSLDPKQKLVPLVDLPPYAWNHDNRYWSESASCRAFRTRKHPRHHLLGYPDEHSTSQEPSWRNYIRVSELPWLEHHRVQSTVLYPFSGMMVMAMEAVRQDAELQQDIEGFRFRHVSVDTAMIITTDQAVESKVQLRPSRRTDSQWKEFTVSSRNHHGVWTQHCLGFISVNYRSSHSPAFTDEMVAWHRRESTKLDDRDLDVKDPEELYRSWEGLGLQWTDSFKSIVGLSSGDYEARFSVQIPDTKAYMPEGFEHPHVIHPTTLDGILQTILPACATRDSPLAQGQVPRFIERAYISHRMASRSAGDELHGYSRYDPWQSEGMVMAFDSQWNSIMIAFEGIRLASISQSSDSPQKTDKAASVWSLEWGLDVDLMSDEALQQFLMSYTDAVAETADDVIHDLELASFIICKRISRLFSADEARNFSRHHALFFDYIQRQYDLGERGRLVCQPPRETPDDWLHLDPEAEELVLSRAFDGSVDGRLLSRVAGSLSQVLRGELEPLQILRQDDILAEYYRSCLGIDKMYAGTSHFIKHLAHKRPLSIIEVGAGTGGTTLAVLSAFGSGREAAARLKQYTYTDISSGFFEEAARALGDYSSLIDYRVMDIERDAAEQGFEVGAYDLVIATKVLHACGSVDGCLNNCRRLLKPDGYLVLVELTSTTARTPMIFGMLNGWWLDESRDELRSILIVQTLAQQQDCESISCRLAREMNSQGIDVKSFLLSDVHGCDLRDKSIVVTVEADRPFLGDISSHFSAIEKLLLESASTLWLTRGATMGCDSPEGSFITGLVRAMRKEHAETQAEIVDLDSTPDLVSDETLSVIARMLRARPPGSERETHTALRDGNVYVPRFHREWSFLQTLSGPEPVRVSPRETGISLVMRKERSGESASFHLAECDEFPTPLGPKDVEIEIKAVSLSQRDITSSSTQSPDNELGLQCSGVVSRTGPAVSQFSAGDRVLTFRPGSGRTFVRNAEHLVYKIPDSVSFGKAASILGTYVSAHYALFDIGVLEPGEKLLVHAEDACIARAAVVLSQMIGAETFVVVSTPSSKAKIVESTAVPEGHVFYRSHHGLAAELNRVTQGQGFDLVLDICREQPLGNAAHCIQPFGRYVELGEGSHCIDVEGDASHKTLVSNCVLFASINMSSLASSKSAVLRRAVSNIMEYIDAGMIKVPEPQAFAFSRFQEALHVLQTGEHDAHHKDRKELMPRLEDSGVEVRVINCDFSNKSDLRQVLDAVKSSWPRMAGVAMFGSLSEPAHPGDLAAQSCQSAILRTLEATRNLHELLPEALDFCIVASPMESMGTRAFASQDVGKLIPSRMSCVSCIATDESSVRNPIIYHGPSAGTRLGRNLHQRPNELYGQPALHNRVAEDSAQDDTPYLNDPCFALVQAEGRGQTQSETAAVKPSSSKAGDLGTELAEARNMGEAVASVLTGLIGKLARLIMVDEKDINPERPASTHHIDSLMAIEVRMWALKQAGSDVSVFEILSNEPLVELAERIGRRSSLVSEQVRELL